MEDLLWVVNSPSLISPSAECSPLSRDEIDPHELRAFVDEQASRKVGPYFERLILYWLKHIRGVTIVAHALPVRAEGKTLGEIDFLFLDERGRLTHWEVAVKFYLYLTGQPHEGSHFVGPNARDSFERKTQRMHEHQLMLSKTIRSDVQIREAFVKGCLFYPPQIDLAREQPRWMSPDHAKGRWVHHRELQRLAVPDGDFRILPKPYWLSVNSPGQANSHAPANSDGQAGAPWMNWPEFVVALDQQIMRYDRPVFAARRSIIDGDTMEFVERFFVVPDEWPNDFTLTVEGASSKTR